MEEFTEDLYRRFRVHLDSGDDEADEIYGKLLEFLDKKRDIELSEPYELEPDITPEQLAQLHREAN